jgi:hypothetical protein
LHLASADERLVAATAVPLNYRRVKPAAAETETLGAPKDSEKDGSRIFSYLLKEAMQHALIESLRAQQPF